MQTRDRINESNVAQGDLAFIYHKTKPMKTGWWRKVREGVCLDKKIYYILEKPMSKNYCAVDAGINSHQEFGLCVMTPHTLKLGIDTNKYEIMATVRGTYSVKLVKHDYSLEYIRANNKYHVKMNQVGNIAVTDRFETLLELYAPVTELKTELETLALDII